MNQLESSIDREVGLLVNSSNCLGVMSNGALSDFDAISLNPRIFRGRVDVLSAKKAMGYDVTDGSEWLEDP